LSGGIDDFGPPHLVFAPNAGLPAFPSWLPSLRRVLGVGSAAAGRCAASAGGRAPFLATDYCEEAVHQSVQLLDPLAPGRCTSRGALNPFRRPVPAAGHGTRLPACGNAVLFGWVDS
jgi:hypothetical protein